MVNSMLYHRQVYWNSDFDIQSAALIMQPYVLSSHIKNHLSNPDEKHDILEIDIVRTILILRKSFISPFEVEVDNNKVVKFVIRSRLNDIKDITIVFGVKDGFNVIKTAWLNNLDDNHYTLNTKKYRHT